MFREASNLVCTYGSRITHAERGDKFERHLENERHQRLEQETNLSDEAQGHCRLLQHTQVESFGRIRQLWRLSVVHDPALNDALQIFVKLLLCFQQSGLGGKCPAWWKGQVIVRLTICCLLLQGLLQAESKLLRTLGSPHRRSHVIHIETRQPSVPLHFDHHFGRSQRPRLHHQHQLLLGSRPHPHLLVQELQQTKAQPTAAATSTSAVLAPTALSATTSGASTSPQHRPQHHHFRGLSQPVVNVETSIVLDSVERTVFRAMAQQPDRIAIDGETRDS